ncbi:hypothetical protein SynBIOSE41_01562 [Synechococcus sp. BIOS-E4-1]|nr:hypothetical protein SynBIOSE41_01562 [Synechococcus sp. BIOS-E4-1]
MTVAGSWLSLLSGAGSRHQEEGTVGCLLSLPIGSAGTSASSGSENNSFE